MIRLFSDIFARKDTIFRRIDVRIKLLVVVPMILSVILSENLLFPGIVFVMVCAAIRVSGVPFHYLMVRFLPALTLVAVVFVLRSITIPGETLIVESIGPFTVTVTREGVYQGFLLAARVMGAVSVMIFLGATTPVYALFGAFRRLGMPSDWVEVALLMYRYVFFLADTTADIATAQKVRLGYTGFGRSVRSLGVLTGAVLTGAVDQAVRTDEGMRTRGYTGRFPVPPVPSMKKRWVMGAFAANLLLWGVWSVLQFQDIRISGEYEQRPECLRQITDATTAHEDIRGGRGR